MIALPTIPAAHRGGLFVYVDFKPDGQPFYVGIGGAERVRTALRYKNPHHMAIVAKHEGCRREIVCLAPSREYANDLESRLIAKFGRVVNGSGILANRSAGGDGYIDPSPAVREARRKAMTGQRWTNRPGANRSAVEAARVALIGNKHTLGLKLSDEAKAKISAAHKGKPKSEEMRARLSRARVERSARVAAFLRATGASIDPRKVTNAMLNDWLAGGVF